VPTAERSRTITIWYPEPPTIDTAVAHVPPSLPVLLAMASTTQQETQDVLGSIMQEMHNTLRTMVADMLKIAAEQQECLYKLEVMAGIRSVVTEPPLLPTPTAATGTSLPPPLPCIPSPQPVVWLEPPETEAAGTIEVGDGKADVAAFNPDWIGNGSTDTQFFGSDHESLFPAQLGFSRPARLSSSSLARCGSAPKPRLCSFTQQSLAPQTRPALRKARMVPPAPHPASPPHEDHPHPQRIGCRVAHTISTAGFTSRLPGPATRSTTTRHVDHRRRPSRRWRHSERPQRRPVHPCRPHRWSSTIPDCRAGRRPACRSTAAPTRWPQWGPGRQRHSVARGRPVHPSFASFPTPLRLLRVQGVRVAPRQRVGGKEAHIIAAVGSTPSLLSTTASSVASRQSLLSAAVSSTASMSASSPILGFEAATSSSLYKPTLFAWDPG
jgi:hypothetical protein